MTHLEQTEEKEESSSGLQNIIYNTITMCGVDCFATAVTFSTLYFILRFTSETTYYFIFQFVSFVFWKYSHCHLTTSISKFMFANVVKHYEYI